MKKYRKILMILLVLSVVLLNAASAFAKTVSEGAAESGLLGATKSVDYAYYDVNTKSFRTNSANCHVLTSDDDDWEGWLVATGDVTISKRVVVNEDVHLILADGCKLTCGKGIEVETAITQDNAHLTIYAQSAGNSKGQLFAYGDESRAGIGTGSCWNGVTGDICGEITIYGGYVKANGGSDAAGIGGGSGANCATVTIYGGEVEANGGNNGAGIGGGIERKFNTGGEGGDVVVCGGVVTATGGGNAAGIGGGGNGGDGGTLVVFDGTVTASSPTGGAGIGGGNGGNGGSVTICGGTVSATGNMYGAGIGGGAGGHGGSLVMHDGKLLARGYYGGAGIGGGSDKGKGDYVEINGGTIEIYGIGGGAGIGGGTFGKGGDVVLNGGTFRIETSGDGNVIGKGDRNGDNGTINVGPGLCVFDKSGEQINGGFDPDPWQDCGYFFVKGVKEFSVRPCGDPVSYIEYDPMFGSNQYECSSYSYINRDVRQWKNGWYVVNETGTITEPVTVSGDVHLILMNSKILTAEKGIRVEEGATLNIYAQTGGTKMGRLIARGADSCAAIGGGKGRNGGNVTIHGGDISAFGGQNAAGLGGGQNGNGASLTLYGGRLAAEAGAGASRAIGAGQGGTDNGGFLVRDGCELNDEATGKIIPRELDTATDWTSLVKNPYHRLRLVSLEPRMRDPVPFLYYYSEQELRSLNCWTYNTICPDSYTMQEGWYVAQGSVTIDHPLSALGDVRLILKDGATLTVNGGICVNEGNSLTIYAQSENENEMGALIADASDTENAGIGAYYAQTGDITIDGGRISAIGGEYSAGIGGSFFSDCGNIKIHGGIVDAESAYAGAGIGSGRYDANFDYAYDSDDMDYDVEFYEWGENGSIVISGGTVHARGEGLGAGIGGGEGYDAGFITISGGKITAQGGDDGAGIGSGYVGYWDDEDWWRTAGVPGGTVNVTGGEVTAVGGGGTSMWEDEKGAFMADTLNISPELSVTVYGYSGKKIIVEKPTEYASECRSRNKAVIKRGAPDDVPVVPKTGDHSGLKLWIALILASSMGLTASIVCGKRKQN